MTKEPKTKITFADLDGFLKIAPIIGLAVLAYLQTLFPSKVEFEKLEQQLLLEEKSETKAILQEKHVQIDRRASWIKGWFFVHFRDAVRAKLPLHAHDSASAGWWCKKSEWDSIWNTQNPWILIPSEHWLRIRHDASAAVLISDTAQVHEWVETKRHAMVAQVKWHNNQWLEISRGIIVKDHWPFLQTHSI